MVHLGIEPGSKAYLLHDPTNHKVVVRKDVVFDEDKGWKWNAIREETYEPGLITFGVRGEIGKEVISKKDDSNGSE